MLFCKIMLIVLTASLSHGAPSFDKQNDKPKGWLWYQDPIPVLKKTERKKENKPLKEKQSQKKPETAVEEMAINRAYYEEVKAKAILYPTIENVTKARRIHNAIIKQAGKFQESWMISELLDNSTPLDSTSPGALRLNKERDEKDLETSLKELSKTHGLIFAIRSGCPYCSQFAPVVTSFAKQYGFEVQGISPDNECFEGMVCTKNIRALYNINPKLEFPMLYFANPSTNEVIPIARGFVSFNTLIANVKYALKLMKDKKNG